MSATDFVRITVDLNAELHRILRLQSARSGRSMSEIVADALRLALREDEVDLAAVRSRSRERSMDYRSFLATVKADGARGGGPKTVSRAVSSVMRSTPRHRRPGPCR